MASDTPQAVGGAKAAVSLVDAFSLTYGALYVRQDLQSFIEGAPMPETFPLWQSRRWCTAHRSATARQGDETGSSDSHFFGVAAPRKPSSYPL
jgi:hypothetical protein